MRILITGDRHWYDPDLAESVIARLVDRHGTGFTIVHGGCPTDVDQSFAEACGELDIPQEVHPARLGELNAPGA